MCKLSILNYKIHCKKGKPNLRKKVRLFWFLVPAHLRRSATHEFIHGHSMTRHEVSDGHHIRSISSYLHRRTTSPPSSPMNEFMGCRTIAIYYLLSVFRLPQQPLVSPLLLFVHNHE